MLADAFFASSPLSFGEPLQIRDEDRESRYGSVFGVSGRRYCREHDRSGHVRARESAAVAHYIIPSEGLGRSARSHKGTLAGFDAGTGVLGAASIGVVAIYADRSPYRM
jgi:hypothetical protein